ncbi:unnamed protein product [Litomosoides sigmodontis]|uniref:Uncharacterized protein n=1 Tax=Litomosoides sigmodontis TaxID=42156 RepID=A0A3P6U1E3_LITSI|nr:unnamed protein product [Litomosoides sigmodontis]
MWKLAKIEEIHKGKDGWIGTELIQMLNGKANRSTSKHPLSHGTYEARLSGLFPKQLSGTNSTSNQKCYEQKITQQKNSQPFPPEGSNGFGRECREFENIINR